MHIQRSPQRQDLLLKLTRANQELKSKGTVDDPVSSQLGWCQEKFVSLEHRLERYEQPTLAEMRSAAQTNARRGRIATTGLTVGAIGTAIAAASQFSNSSLAFPICLAATAGLGIAAARTGLRAGENSRTAAELGQWQKAFAAG